MFKSSKEKFREEQKQLRLKMVTIIGEQRGFDDPEKITNIVDRLLYSYEVKFSPNRQK